MILKVFLSVGSTLSYAGAYAQLVSLYAGTGTPYAKNKAAGSLGGAVNAGTIELRNGMYCRVK